MRHTGKDTLKKRKLLKCINESHQIEKYLKRTVPYSECNRTGPQKGGGEWQNDEGWQLLMNRFDWEDEKGWTE